jgi:hypothetical protein
VGVTAGAGLVGAVSAAVPQTGQKRATGGRLSPHEPHADARTRAPHCTQNRALWSFCCRHSGHCTSNLACGKSSARSGTAPRHGRANTVPRARPSFQPGNRTAVSPLLMSRRGP